jgi:hypothetical protein
MADIALKLSKEKLVEGLSDLSFKEIDKGDNGFPDPEKTFQTPKSRDPV